MMAVFPAGIREGEDAQLHMLMKLVGLFFQVIYTIERGDSFAF